MEPQEYTYQRTGQGDMVGIFDPQGVYVGTVEGEAAAEGLLPYLQVGGSEFTAAPMSEPMSDTDPTARRFWALEDGGVVAAHVYTNASAVMLLQHLNRVAGPQ